MKEFFLSMNYAALAFPRDVKRPAYEHPAELGNAFAPQGVVVVHEMDAADPVAFFDFLHFKIHIRRAAVPDFFVRIFAVVAVDAGEGTAPGA